MADAKSPDPKSDDVKTGPVKPPVLDLQARKAGKPDAMAKPAADTKPLSEPKPAAAADPAPAASKPNGRKPPVRPERGVAFGAAIAGGVIGLVAAYGLAYLGYWPSVQAQAVQPDPRLAQLSRSVPELQTVTQTTQSELAALNARVAGLEQAGGSPATPAAAPVELGTMKADIAALSARIEGLTATPATAVAPADIAALKSDIAGVTSRLDELGARVGTAEAGLRTLETSVSAISAALAEQPADVGAVLQLPLVLSGLEAAFASGRPYEAELAALRAALPDAAVPTEIANGAAGGLARPDVIATKFAAVLPAMLAGRPANPDAGWQDSALDWFRSAIALRPTGEMEGDTPEAVVSRLDGAIARRDYGAAEALFASLPQPMRDAASDVPALVHQQAQASVFLQSLRDQALKGSAP